METIHRSCLRIIGGGVLIILIMILSSCTATKEVRQQSRKERLEKKLHKIERIDSEIKTTTDTRTINETKISETADTLIRQPGEKISGAISCQNLYQGERLHVETGGMTLDVFRDSLSGVIRAQAVDKGQDIPVQFSTVTERKEVVDQKQKTTQNDKISVENKQQQKKEDCGATVEKTVEKFSIPFWIWIVVTIVVVLGVAIMILRKFFR